MIKLIILPTQLFNIKYLHNIANVDMIYIWEHPQYFTKYNFNKKKLILHRASMKYYFKYLKDHNYNVNYLEFNDKFKKNKQDIIYLFDPIDNFDLGDIQIDKIIESPNFLLTLDDYKKYRKKTDKFQFHNFYKWAKKTLNIIPDVKSKDKYNRSKIKGKISIPDLPINNYDKKYVSDATKYVDKHFYDNYGNIDNFIYPISHNSAESWKLDFFENKLDKFGPYQDFIYDKQPYLYHSCLSSSINIGLICPYDIIDYLLPLIDEYPINSFEGYIRQLFWREYQRYTYIYCDFNSDYFGNTKKLSSQWYSGSLGIPPVDDYIKIGFDTGYLHHIIRLMVIGNFMNLYGIRPSEGFKWFMEFSIDSYEWVMKQNVLDMVFFCTGGKTMRKPYASSSNYILKMSTYKKGDWCDTWDNLYYDFMCKNKDKLWKFRYHFPGLKKMDDC